MFPYNPHSHQHLSISDQQSFKWVFDTGFSRRRKKNHPNYSNGKPETV